VKGSSRRPEQVAETIRQVVADALLRGQVRDPRVGLVTVTRVDVTPDRSHATIYVRSQGDEAERDRAVEGLRSAAGFLRGLVARVLTSRTVPQIHIEADRGAEHAGRISELLEGIRRESQD
jgi:ribosome-binding factor A